MKAKYMERVYNGNYIVYFCHRFTYPNPYTIIIIFSFVKNILKKKLLLYFNKKKILFFIIINNIYYLQNTKIL